MIEPRASGKSAGQQPVWRFVYWSALTTILAWAAWQRFSLPLDPIADPDTWGYLSPALQKLIGESFGHAEGRNFLYSGFLFGVLRFSGDFRAIVVVQHLLGLAAGALLLLAWRRVRVFVPASRLTPSGHDTFGLAAAAIFLLAGEPVRAEMQLRPEGIFAFVLSVNLSCAIKFIASAFVEKRRRATVGFGIGTAFSALLLACLKPSFVLVACRSAASRNVSAPARVGTGKDCAWMRRCARCACVTRARVCVESP